MKHPRDFIKNTLREFLNEQKNTKDYYVLYHATDSDFFDTINYDNAKKGDRYFNPLGNGLYFSTNENFIKKFGKNTYYYLLPKSAKIKKITYKTWTESVYNSILKKVLKKYNIDYWKDTTLDQKVELNRLANNPPITSLNELSYLLSASYNLSNVQETIENVVDKINRPYDAIWYKETDYYQQADEILIPTSSFKKELFVKELPKFLNENQIDQIRNTGLSLNNKIQGGFLNKKQAEDLQKEIESNYDDGIIKFGSR